MKNVFMSMAALVLLVSCENNHMQVLESKKIGGSTPMGSGVGFDQVKPIFEAKCFSCHGAGKMNPKDWTVYEVAKADLTKLNDRLFVSGGMPMTGKLSAQEKQTIKMWIEAGGPLVGSAQGPVVAEPEEETPDTDTPVESNDPVVRGEFIVQTKCLSCHGEGASAMVTPVLHGQYADYLIKELNNFKNDQRKDLVMNAMPTIAKGLSDQDISDVAAYLSKQTICGVRTPVNTELGDAQQGQIKAEQNACIGCHRDENTLGAAKLEGQKAEYVLHSLKAFQTHARTSAFMNPLVANFSETDLKDLSAYFNSLRKCE